MDRGDVPIAASTAELTCTACGLVATVPVVGIASAQVGQGLVFDTGEYATPKRIQCRNCRKIFERE